MKHSDMQKDRKANSHVVCSGNKLCRDCREARKLRKRLNNKGIRRIDMKLIEEAMDDV